MPTVLMTGGTGLIGRALTGMLQQRGYRIKLLTRRKQAAEAGIQYLFWDPNGEIAGGRFTGCGLSDSSGRCKCCGKAMDGST